MGLFLRKLGLAKNTEFDVFACCGGGGSASHGVVRLRSVGHALAQSRQINCKWQKEQHTKFVAWQSRHGPVAELYILVYKNKVHSHKLALINRRTS